ncbi:MAG: hypothetical protein K2K97_08620 [Muribaculaceae bacterium]|nr:hypothetical protein [Muribaculaceae bacterium]
METKNCPYCGGEIKSIAKKCKHCGKWLDNHNQPVTYESKNITPSSASVDPAATNSNDKTKIIFIVGALIFALVIITIIIITGHSKSDYENVYEDYSDEAVAVEEVAIEEPYSTYESGGSYYNDDYSSDNSYRTDSYDPYSDANAWN